MKYRCITLDEISLLLNVSCIGYNYSINGLNLCNRITCYDSIISYVNSESYISYIDKNRSIKALFVTPYIFDLMNNDINNQISFFVVENPEELFYKLHDLLLQETLFYKKEILPPQVGYNCQIAPSAVLEDGVMIGNNVIIGPNSVIRTGVILDDFVRIGCCSVIGSEGFQAIRLTNEELHLVSHVGGTHLCKHVCIGDNTTVGNALFEGYTIIGENTKVDNQVYIAHNCIIGKNNVITANVSLMGSTIIKDHTWIAPGTIVLNRKVVKDHGFVGAMSLVTKDVLENSVVVGIPAKDWGKK